MKEAIEKALENGWRMPVSLKRISGWKVHNKRDGVMVWYEFTKEEAIAGNQKFVSQQFMPKIRQYLSYAEITSDPSFWQTFSRVNWLERWHAFVDHLASGKSIHRFFNPLQ